MFGLRMYFLPERPLYPLARVGKTKTWDSDLTNKAQTRVFPSNETKAWAKNVL